MTKVMKMKKILWSCLIIFLFNSINIFAVSFVKVATLFDYAPFCMAEKGIKYNQKIIVGDDAVGFKGFSWDVLRESFHVMNYSIDLSISPWARAMHLSRNGSVDVLFPTGKNKKRQEIYNYSNESVNDATFLLYVNKNSSLQWKGLDSLKGLKIAVIRGYNFGDEWEQLKDITKVPINGILQGFKMLEANRIDGFIGYEYNWDYVLKQENIKHKYKKLPSFGSTSEYLVTLKSNPNGKQILKTFDEGKKILINNGQLEKLKIKWFGK